MKKAKFLIVAMLIASLSAVAARAQFTATTSKNPVSAGETFEVKFTINGDGKNFRAPSFKGFSVLSGPNTSQSVSIVNGNMSRSVTYSYYLRADKPGSFSIGSAAIQSDGKTLKTKPLQIKVVKGQTSGSSGSDGSSQSDQASKIMRENFFVRLTVNKTNVYIGEPLVATYKLYVHPELAFVNTSLPGMPAFTGFWAQDIEEISQLKLNQIEKINGVPFRTQVIKKVLLAPQQSGKLTIDPIEVETTIKLRVQSQSRRRRGFFDDPFGDFFGQYKTFKHTASSGSKTIFVQALPDGAPANFSGAVGRIDMEAWLDQTSTKANEPVSLKIKISGRGNLKLIDALDIELPPDIETFDPKAADNLSLTSEGFTGNKTFEYLLIPRRQGEYKIEPVSFTYFDLAKKQYVTLTSDPFTLKVTKGDGSGASSVISGVAKEDIEYLGKDVRYIKTDPGSLASGGKFFAGSALFWILSFFPLAFFIFFIVLRRKALKQRENAALFRNKKAAKAARKRLRAANNAMKSAGRDLFYLETSKALWGFLGDKLGIPTADLTRDAAKEALEAKGVDEDLTARAIAAIDKCEFARFAPAEDNSEMKNTYDETAALIAELEGKLK